MVSQDQQQAHLQNPIFFLNSLLCEEEEHFEQDLGVLSQESETLNNKPPLSLLDHDLFWENDELVCLLSKEKQTPLSSGDESLMDARKVAINWVLRVCSHYGFAGLTAFLAVNYFDRFISSLRVQKDKPWMIQLAAVACLSLAAKVEETRVPLLIDFQVEESKFVFDSRNILRMELLVLSSLGWKMNPVTPFSFIDHIVRRLGLKTFPHWGFIRCERLLLSAINDSRFLCYPPSVIATATMFLVMEEVDPCNALEYQNQLIEVLKISKEKVDECCNLFMELSSDCGQKQYVNHKRNYCSIPSSPNGVIDGYFSYDSSDDSWALASSGSTSQEPLFKRSKTQNQQIRLAPLNHASINVLSGSN